MSKDENASQVNPQQSNGALVQVSETDEEKALRIAEEEKKKLEITTHIDPKIAKWLEKQDLFNDLKGHDNFLNATRT